MKKWDSPEVWELNIKNTELYDAGGANDGGYIDNPSGIEGHHDVPGHWKS